MSLNSQSEIHACKRLTVSLPLLLRSCSNKLHTYLPTRNPPILLKSSPFPQSLTMEGPYSHFLFSTQAPVTPHKSFDPGRCYAHTQHGIALTAKVN
jgi:hypothetical protein